MTADRKPLPRLNPKKLLLSKWTVVVPRDKDLHFLVSKVIEPEAPDTMIESVELEAVYARRVLILPWRELEDSRQWRHGWQSLEAMTSVQPRGPHE